jgi:hypothetical protein
MRNEKIGLYSAIVAGLATAIFAISILVDNILLISFGICIVLSFSYIILTCAFAAQANQDKKVFAYAGLSFASIYAVFINLVYFTQLTTVNQQAASKDVINVLTYTPGSWIFSLDIFGYAMMAVSTFFVGLTILPINRIDKWLKALLTLHGLFAFGIVIPMLNLFNGTDGDSTNKMGVIVLEIWCLFFIPMMMLAAKYFKERCETAQHMNKSNHNDMA